LATISCRLSRSLGAVAVSWTDACGELRSCMKTNRAGGRDETFHYDVHPPGASSTSHEVANECRPGLMLRDAPLTDPVFPANNRAENRGGGPGAESAVRHPRQEPRAFHRIRPTVSCFYACCLQGRRARGSARAFMNAVQECGDEKNPRRFRRGFRRSSD